MDGMQSVPMTREFMMEHVCLHPILLVRFLYASRSSSRCFSYDVSFRTPRLSYSSADEECKVISLTIALTHPGIPATKMHVLNIPAVESICCLMGPYRGTAG
jgi:hypothetical protein